MNTKMMNLPSCFRGIKKISSKEEYEKLLNEEENLEKGKNVTCSDIRKRYNFESSLCKICDFNVQRLSGKTRIPSNVEEAMILNLAQENQQILQANEPIIITDPTDKRLSSLTAGNYIALNFMTPGRASVYSEDSSRVYSLCLLYNDEMIAFLNKLLNKKFAKVIVENIEVHNSLIDYGIKVRNLIPLNVINSSLNICKMNIKFENLISEFKNVESKVDSDLLSYISLSLKTDYKIKIEDLDSGFYKVKAIEQNDELSTIVVYTKSTLDSLQSINTSYKEFYYNLATTIRKDYNIYKRCKHEHKLKFNIVEISDKFIFTTKKENRQYVTNLIFFAFDKVAHSFSPNNEQVLEFSYK
ncbi:MAG: hypothetical protein AB7V48_00610 [Sedimentibacter sp.]